MTILLLGSGGREHALAESISKSPICKQLYIIPGNPGTAKIGVNIDAKLNDFENIKKIALNKQVNLVVCGPEGPLSEGISDAFAQDPDTQDIAFIGPKKAGARLESSKDYAKAFMMRHHIPTAAYKSFTQKEAREAKLFLQSFNPPYVLKADGLAAGKGVIITESITEAETELDAMFDGKFGDAGSKVVIEQFLEGIELSVFALTDGQDYVLLPEAKDYKRIGENDTGLNTGGMGAVSPVPFADKAFMKKVEEKIVAPTIAGLKKDGTQYTGFLFFGLMKVEDEAFVIEYNVRMGDPETEAVLPRIESDFTELLLAAAQNKLKEYKIKISKKSAATVILVSGGYPEAYEKGKTISGHETLENCRLFHMGTKMNKELLQTGGGRVLALSSLAENYKAALKNCYKAAETVNFEGKYYRKDIGFDL